MFREEYNAIQENDLVLADSIKAGIWTAIPAIIQSVDYSKFTVTAQPAIKGIVVNADNEQEYVNLPLLVDVPIMFPSAGGWHLTFPVKEGDECLVVFSCRCIDAWWQNGSIQNPMEQRMLDLSDGFAILAPYSQPKAKEVNGGISANSVILKDTAKQNYIEITNEGNANVLLQGNLKGEIKGDVTLDISGNADANVKGNVTLKVGGNISAQATEITLAANKVTIDAPMTSITSNLTIGGATQASGAITCASDVTGAGISLSGHIHGGVMGGSATTSTPQ